MCVVVSGEVEGWVGSVGILFWYCDLQMVLFYGVCSVLVLFGLLIYWIYIVWLVVFGVMLLVVVVCSLFVNCDNVVVIGLSFLCGIVYVILVVMLVSQWLLLQWNGFLLFCLVMGVLLFFVILGMVVLVIVGIVILFVIYFIVLVVLCNQMDYDFVILLNFV